MGFLKKLFGGGDAVPQVQQVEEGGELRQAIPEGELETAIVELRAERMGIEEVADRLVRARLFVPSPQDVDERLDRQGFKPVVVELPSGLFVPAFTSVERASAMQDQNIGAASGIETEAAWIVKNLPPELGLFINPGWTSSLMLPAATLAQMRDHFSL